MAGVGRRRGRCWTRSATRTRSEPGRSARRRTGACARRCRSRALLWPVELGREESRRALEDLVRAAQLGVLPAQPLQLGGLVGADPGALAGVDLGLADPFTQRLRGTDAEFLGYRG